MEDDLFVMIAFNCKLINEDIKFDKEEILDVKWFEYNKIINDMEGQLRGSYVKTAIINNKQKLIAPIEIVNILK